MKGLEMNVVAGIDEERLSALSLEVLEYTDKISELFNKIDACMGRLPTYYKGPPSDEIIRRYNEIKSSYQIIKENLISYSDDLIMLINKMRENDKYLSGLFQNFTNDTNNQIRVNNFNLK